MEVIKWRYTDETCSVVAATFPDGHYESHVVTAERIQAWLADGNTPQPYVPTAIDPKEQAKAELSATDAEASRFGEDALRHLIMSGQLTPNAALAKKLADRDYLRAIIRGDVPAS